MMLFDMIISQSSDLASPESSVTAVVKPVAETISDGTVDTAAADSDNIVDTVAKPLPLSDR